MTPRSTKVKLISSAEISTSLHKVFKARRAKMAENGEEASQPSSLTAPRVGVCNTLQRTTPHPEHHALDLPQHTATNCNTLQLIATYCNKLQHPTPHPQMHAFDLPQHTATYCKTLQHPTPHHSIMHLIYRNTLQRSASLDLPQHTATSQHTATHYNTLPNAATYLNTLQHITPHPQQ